MKCLIKKTAMRTVFDRSDRRNKMSMLRNHKFMVHKISLNNSTKYLLLFITLLHLMQTTNAVKGLGNWMALGMQGSVALQNPDLFLLGSVGSQKSAGLCQKIKGLSNGQKKLCMLYTDHMMHVGRGASTGIGECQYQFKDNRWNCSTVDDSTVFGPILTIPSKEAAFANAVASAGVVHSISRGCRDGQLASCGCSEARRPRDLRKEWIWGGCGDNIHYGYKFAKNFIDIREREMNVERGTKDHGRQLMNLHNNEAGRRAVIKSMKVTCKCHGVSGSCSLITCWQQLAPFRKVGDHLEEKYNAATRVKTTRRGRLKVKRKDSKIPTANELVFLKRSPDYCHQNGTIGSLGTQGRVCKRDSKGLDGCDMMCCGRGYNMLKTKIKERCKCKFHWCCYVECKTCTKDVELTVCK